MLPQKNLILKFLSKKMLFIRLYLYCIKASLSLEGPSDLFHFKIRICVCLCVREYTLKKLKISPFLPSPCMCIKTLSQPKTTNN